MCLALFVIIFYCIQTKVSFVHVDSDKSVRVKPLPNIFRRNIEKKEKKSSKNCQAYFQENLRFCAYFHSFITHICEHILLFCRAC